MFVSSFGRTENVLLENAEFGFFVIRSRPTFMVLIPLWNAAPIPEFCIVFVKYV